MTDKTKAMDNLIAQDADLIDDQPVLLPCPFCGGAQIKAFHHIDRGWGASWHVECIADECGNSTCHHDTEAAAIAAWNKRQPTQSDALREALWAMPEPYEYLNKDQLKSIRPYIDALRNWKHRYRAVLQKQSK